MVKTKKCELVYSYYFRNIDKKKLFYFFDILVPRFQKYHIPSNRRSRCLYNYHATPLRYLESSVDFFYPKRDIAGFFYNTLLHQICELFTKDSKTYEHPKMQHKETY